MTTVAMPVFSKQNETVSTAAVLLLDAEKVVILAPLTQALVTFLYLCWG